MPEEAVDTGTDIVTDIVDGIVDGIVAYTGVVIAASTGTDDVDTGHQTVVIADQVDDEDEGLVSVEPLHVSVIGATEDTHTVVAQEVASSGQITTQIQNFHAFNTYMDLIKTEQWGCNTEVYYPKPGVPLTDQDLMMIICTTQEEYPGLLKGVIYTSPDTRHLYHAWKPYYDNKLRSMHVDGLMELEEQVIRKCVKWCNQRSDAPTVLSAELTVTMPEDLLKFPTCFPPGSFTVERQLGVENGMAKCCDNKMCCLEDHHFVPKVGTMQHFGTSTLGIISLESQTRSEYCRTITNCVVDYYNNRGMYKTKKVQGDGITEIHDLCEHCVMKYAVGN